jgi:hypothetical protein
MEPCLGIRLVCPRELLALKSFSLEEAAQTVALILQASSRKPSLPQDGAHSMTVTGGGHSLRIPMARDRRCRSPFSGSCRLIRQCMGEYPSRILYCDGAGLC